MSIVNAVDVVCENGYVFRIRAEYTVEDTLTGIESSHQKRGCRILDGSGKVADPGQVLGSLKGPIMLTGGENWTRWQGIISTHLIPVVIFLPPDR